MNTKEAGVNMLWSKIKTGLGAPVGNRLSPFKPTLGKNSTIYNVLIYIAVTFKPIMQFNFLLD